MTASTLAKVTLLDQALALRELGCSVLPVNLQKKPLVHEWRSLQTSPATAEQIGYWAAALKPAGWAVITGRASARVIVDFDGEEGKERLKQFGLKPHVQTGSGGAHVHLVHPCARVNTMNARSAKNWPWPGVDVRGDGGYAIAVGRNVNGAYEQLRAFDDLDPFELLPLEFQRLVVRAETVAKVENPHWDSAQTIMHSGALEERLLGTALEMAWRGQGRNNSGFWLACQLRDNAYSLPDSYGIMRRYAGKCPTTNVKGQPEPYTELEIRNSLTQAFSAPARDPWGVR